MSRKILPLIALLLLAGCATQQQINEVVASQRAPTAKEKAAIVAYVKKTFYDPYSIRDASISGSLVLLDTGYKAICIRTNSKNRMGGYVGLHTTSIRFKGGVVVSALDNAPGCNHEGLRYTSFPALENL